MQFKRGHYDEYIYEIILNLDQWLRRRGCLKVYSIFSSGCHLCHFGRRRYEEHFGKIVLNLDQ